MHALRGVSLRVRRGEVHGLIGQNGAGKSTLMKILDGYYPAGSFTGGIKVAGAEVRLHSPRDAQAVGIAIVPQETTVVEALTVAENVLLGELAQHPAPACSAGTGRGAGRRIPRREPHPARPGRPSVRP